MPLTSRQNTENYGVIIQRKPNKLRRHEDVRFEVLKCYMRDLEYFMLMGLHFNSPSRT
jgi:hypothetical protein